MCGIVCLIRNCSAEEADDSIPDSLRQTCDRRGPDAQATFRYTSSSSTAVSLHASVLSLRGKEVTPQPIRSPDGRLVLAWNGQIFRHEGDENNDEENRSSLFLDAAKNDGEELLKVLERVLQTSESGEDVGLTLAGVLKAIEGPYAFVLLDTETQYLYFGRDPLGRRSLLMRRSVETGDESLMLCSVADQGTIAAGSSFVEVDCSRSIWCVDLNPLVLSDLQSATPLHEPCFSERLASAHTFRAVLEDSVRRRVTNIRAYTSSHEAHVAVLFSGGLDCATVALLAHQYLDPAQPIDLLNVALENPRSLAAAAAAAAAAARARSDTHTPSPSSEEEVVVDPYDVPDRQTGKATFVELCKLTPGRKWNFVRVDVPYDEYCGAREEIRGTMYPSNSVVSFE
ncbi:unnamed protein product [Tilletia caries]|uniref:Glutamine amidotransferase type-2 domain-containing protein n=1 Tax=Tilletia caries TaxID=13290 RepID=A0ABN7IL95_9BASI|nr:unnamed protein product [Tilletia caries]